MSEEKGLTRQISKFRGMPTGNMKSRTDWYKGLIHTNRSEHQKCASSLEKTAGPLDDAWGAVKGFGNQVAGGAQSAWQDAKNSGVGKAVSGALNSPTAKAIGKTVMQAPQIASDTLGQAAQGAQSLKQDASKGLDAAKGFARDRVAPMANAAAKGFQQFGQDVNKKILDPALKATGADQFNPGMLLPDARTGVDMAQKAYKSSPTAQAIGKTVGQFPQIASDLVDRTGDAFMAAGKGLNKHVIDPAVDAGLPPNGNLGNDLRDLPGLLSGAVSGGQPPAAAPKAAPTAPPAAAPPVATAPPMAGGAGLTPTLADLEKRLFQGNKLMGNKGGIDLSKADAANKWQQVLDYEKHKGQGGSFGGITLSPEERALVQQQLKRGPTAIDEGRTSTASARKRAAQAIAKKAAQKLNK